MRTLALMALSIGVAQAADPRITHQGRLLDSVGVSIEGQRAVHLSLFDDPVNGVDRWSADFNPTFAGGYYSVTMGPDPTLTSALSTYPDLWLEIAVNGATLSPREYLGAVPRAVTAVGAGGLSWSTSRLNFGTATIGDSATATLTNSGAVAAEDLSIAALDGFDTSTDCGSTLAAGASCDTTVTYQGPGTGTRNSVVVAASTTAGSATAILSGSFGNALLGNGADGTLTVNSQFDITSQIGGSNRAGYADGIAYAVSSVSSSQIIVETAPNGIIAGDRVLLAILQASPSTDVGNYNVFDVTAVSGNTVTVASGIDPSRYDEGSSRKLVMQRVPQYTDVTVAPAATLTTSAWDALASVPSGIAGERTGIVAFLVSGTLQNLGTITASGRGYRGGPDNNFSYNSSGGGHGYYGEGLAGGWPTRGSWRIVSADGGGGGGWVPTTGCCHGNGGGGGGYATSGGRGSIDGIGRTGSPSNGATTEGGATYGFADLSRLVPGGGGGSGGSHSGTNAGCSASDAECNTGGTGGGIVFIRANTIDNDGAITAEGQAGFPQPGTAGCDTKRTTNTQDGSGGSGAGGSILLQADTLLDSSGTIRAVGGEQGCRTGYGSSNNDRERGGAGGDGRVRIEADSIIGAASPAASTGSF